MNVATRCPSSDLCDSMNGWKTRRNSLALFADCTVQCGWILPSFWTCCSEGPDNHVSATGIWIPNKTNKCSSSSNKSKKFIFCVKQQISFRGSSPVESDSSILHTLFCHLLVSVAASWLDVGVHIIGLVVGEMDSGVLKRIFCVRCL